MTAPREDDKTRVDRELLEFLNELRVALPGVQVLFAFLLIVPFNQRFTELGRPEQRVYLAAVVSTALSSVLLMAPAAQHRLRFRHVDKAQLIGVATKLAVVGLGLLALAITASVHLVAAFIFGAGTAAVVASTIAALAVLIWFVLPLLYRPSPYNELER